MTIPIWLLPWKAKRRIEELESRQLPTPVPPVVDPDVASLRGELAQCKKSLSALIEWVKVSQNLDAPPVEVLVRQLAKELNRGRFPQK